MRSFGLVMGLAGLVLSGCSSGAGMPASVDMAMSSGQCSHTTLCTDESVLNLSLFRPVSAGAIMNESSGTGFVSTVDATAGGVTPSQSYVYAKFTASGLEKVDIGDEDALSSTAWDIAFRRFVIRLNSGVSGPSCVSAARTGPTTTFDGLTSVPSGLDYRIEEYFTSSCELVPDGSGIGSPGTAMQSFWEYPGCVKMTGNIFVVQRADGSHVKLLVQSYYSQAAQAQCDTQGTIPMTNTGSGMLKIKWAPIQ